MKSPYTDIAEFSPEDFEKHVQDMITMSGIDLEEFHTSRREKLEGRDGEYEIDVVARFTALKTSFLVLIECKHHKSPIKREVVQVLRDRMQSIGAQKGMIFSSVKFQKGAIEYAKAHGIALVKVTDAEPEYYNRIGKVDLNMIPTRKGAWLIQLTEDNKVLYTAMGLYNPKVVFEAMNIQQRDSEPNAGTKYLTLSFTPEAE